MEFYVPNFSIGMAVSVHNFRLACIFTNALTRANFKKLRELLLSKGVIFRGRNNRPINVNIYFEPNELNVRKHFTGFGTFFGTVIHYVHPFYQVR
jgi:hypothetical protein